VLTLVQLDPLLAVFPLTTVGQQVVIRFSNEDETATSTVEFISPVADAESGRVLVKICIRNPAGIYRSGTRCTLWLPSSAEQTRGDSGATITTQTSDERNAP
jgi:hypothetical protein